MNTTIKRTHQRSDPFSRVPKDVLALPHLSWKAKGILAYLLGKPSNWKIRQLDLLSLLCPSWSDHRNLLRSKVFSRFTLFRRRYGSLFAPVFWPIASEVGMMPGCQGLTGTSFPGTSTI